MAENARLATDMDSEQKLQLCGQNNSHARGLATARTQEISHRRDLIPKADELEALRKWHPG
jgi:kinesin family member C1